MTMPKIILATNNAHKRQKLGWVVEGVFDATAMPESIDIDENGDTFEENAKIKAVETAQHFHQYAIASDGGALIPSLGYKWDALLTRRFVGLHDATDWDRIEALLELMKDKVGNERRVEWREAIAVSDPDGNVIFSVEVEGDVGMIQADYDKSQYRDGIWLCTLTSYPQFGGKNFFELTEEETKEGEISWWRLKEAFTKFFATKD